METLNVLYNIEEKQETRPLYEEVFPEDKGEFLDYYYEDRCRDNVIIDIKRENAVIAMAHFNPFTMETRDGRTFPVMYIYAVSTKKEGLYAEDPYRGIPHHDEKGNFLLLPDPCG